MNQPPIYIGAVGMACPVGRTWASACAAIRAGVSRHSISTYHDDRGREIVASFFPELTVDAARPEERWLTLLACALRDATRDGRARPERMPIFLAVPEAKVGRYHARFITERLSRLGVHVPVEHMNVFAEGARGSIAALQRARAWARANGACVVAAADSLLSAHRLHGLSAAGRLLVDGNSDGVVPGEAAAAVVLSRAPGPAQARLLGLGLADEPSRLDNDVPLRAEGLVAASRVALAEAGLGLHDLDFRVSDAAGESFYFKEQALLVTRLLRVRKPEFPLWLPALSLGSTGTAAGLCGLLVALAAWARGYAPGPRALICAGDDQGARGATIVERAI